MGFGGGSGERGGRCDARRQPLLLSLGGAACIASSPLPVVTSSAHRRLNVVTAGPLVSSSLQGGPTLAAVAAAAASLVRTVGQVAAQPAASISPSPRGLDLFVRGVSSVLRKVLVSRPVDLSPLRLPLLFFLTLATRVPWLPRRTRDRLPAEPISPVQSELCCAVRCSHWPRPYFFRHLHRLIK